jgi:two-component system OmpR family response regulator
MLQLGTNHDFVLLDLMLPDGDGVEVLRQIRESNYTSRVLVTTAVSDPGRLGKVCQLRPEAVLQKPIDVARLLKMIEPVN